MERLGRIRARSARIVGLSRVGRTTLAAGSGGLFGAWLGPIGIVGLGASAFALPLWLPLAAIFGASAWMLGGRRRDVRAPEAEAPALPRFDLPDWLEGVPAHRAFLLDAIRSARRSVVIRSGFASAHALDARLIEEMRAFVLRGGVLYLEWGWRGRLSVVTPHEREARARLRRLRRALPRKRRSDLRVTYHPTHGKEVAIDGAVGTVGSFNWLSNASRSPHANRERTLVRRDPALAGDIERDAVEVWARARARVSGNAVALPTDA